MMVEESEPGSSGQMRNSGTFGVNVSICEQSVPSVIFEPVSKVEGQSRVPLCHIGPQKHTG